MVGRVRLRLFNANRELTSFQAPATSPAIARTPGPGSWAAAWEEETWAEEQVRYWTDALAASTGNDLSFAKKKAACVRLWCIVIFIVFMTVVGFMGAGVGTVTSDYDWITVGLR